MTEECVKGNLYIVSGPSGAGKGTIVKRLLEIDDTVALSISCTTRAPRNHETDGVHYYFLSKQEFEDMIAKGEFLEYADVFGNYYGTPLPKVEERLAEGKNVLLEIDVVGAMLVKDKIPDGKLIFIMPPSFEELERRLRGRRTESEEQIKTRLSKAQAEMNRSDEYDYVVLNDEVETAAQKIKAIIQENYGK